MQKHDIFCLSETFLNSSVPTDNSDLQMNGYNLIHSDHPSNAKRGGFTNYYDSWLPLKRRDDLNLLQECIVCEFFIGNKIMFYCFQNYRLFLRETLISSKVPYHTL